MSQNAYVPPTGAALELAYINTDLLASATPALAGNATLRGTLIPSRGAKRIAVAVQASQAGTCALTGYLDAAGTNKAFTVTKTLAAGVAQVLNAPSGIPFLAWDVTFVNTNNTSGTCQVNNAAAQA